MKEQAKKSITEIVFILDKSGSMRGYESDTVGGFNSMLQREQEDGGEAYVTTVLFATETVRLHDRLPIGEVKPMTKEDYRVGGCTALLDAVGDTVRHITDIHKYVRSEDIPAKTLVVITTDGLENASHRYSKAEISQMIRQKTEECGWEFIFLGAGIDAVEEAGEIGIPETHAAECRLEDGGIDRAYRVIGSVVNGARYGRSCMIRDHLDELMGEEEEKK